MAPLLHHSNSFLPANLLNIFLANCIRNQDPVFLGRLGLTEINTLTFFYRFLGSSSLACLPKQLRAPIKKSVYKLSYPILEKIQILSGFFPVDTPSLERLYYLYVESLSNINIFASWARGESHFRYYLNNPITCDLLSIEPWFSALPWTQALEGQNVLVVHPFAESIQSQYSFKRQNLFANPLVLPAFNLLPLKAVQGLAGSNTGFANWFDALEFMKSKISTLAFDTAILGCGCFALPLASYIKRLGKNAIILGGATQLLFGIRGSRWDCRENYLPLFNSHWIRPSPSELIPGSDQVENSCYW